MARQGALPPHHRLSPNSHTHITAGAKRSYRKTYLIFVGISPDGHSYFEGKYHQEEDEELKGKKRAG